jgi:hypothetical protein
VNATQVEAPNALQVRALGLGANLWLSGDQLERPLQLFVERERRLLTMGTPPVPGLYNRRLRAEENVNRKRSLHRFLRSSSTSATGRVSPRSACASAAASMASSSGLTAKVSSPSGIKTVARAPSGRTPSSTSTAPWRTTPVAISMREFYQPPTTRSVLAMLHARPLQIERQELLEDLLVGEVARPAVGGEVRFVELLVGEVEPGWAFVVEVRRVRCSPLDLPGEALCQEQRRAQSVSLFRRFAERTSLLRAGTVRHNPPRWIMR